MIAIDIIILFCLVFGLGYIVGRSGKGDSKSTEEAATKARRELEDQAIANGFGDIVVVDGHRRFQWRALDQDEAPAR